MRNLATAVFQTINNAHDYRTVQGHAPQGTDYPFVSYSLLPIDPTAKHRDDFTLQIRVWDESTSHATAMEIADSIKQAFTYFRFIDTHNLIIASRPSIGYVPDSDASIVRYDVSMTLMTYRRDQY